MTGYRGNAVVNQFIIETDYCRYFQSYDSIICLIKNNGETVIDPNYWDYSTTTGKYRNIFLGESKKETQRKINSGQYKTQNLN